jgi:OHCU decarboxylase
VTGPARTPHAVLNAMAMEDARRALGRCCGSARWVEGMLARRPFSSEDELDACADAVWAVLGRADYLEAFAQHPAIGTSTASAWSAQEQSRVAEAGADTVASLRDLNQTYARRFGYTFIVCATGKRADEMLAQLRARLDNQPEAELAVAAAEQAKITRLRLHKLASSEGE